MKNKKLEQKVRAAQKNEMVRYIVYRSLSQSTNDARNKEVLDRISRDELRHYNLWKDFTKRVEKPSQKMVWAYYLISRVVGLMFGIKLMERGENKEQVTYHDFSNDIPEALNIAKEESEHEKQLLTIIDDERLNYIGSTIRGLNTSIVELVGVLAGLTLALQDSRLIAMAGLITGVAVAMSVSSTEYLASKSEDSAQHPLKSALYSGIAGIITVILLISPYFLFSSIYASLGLMLIIAIVVITVFNFYISVVKNLSFWKRFSEMALLSLGIAAVSFAIGFVVRQFFGV